MKNGGVITVVMFVRLGGKMNNQYFDLSCKELLQRAKELYGSIDGGLTLEEIGIVMGISRERVRQIEKEVIKKLKHPKLGIRLKKYIEY